MSRPSRPSRSSRSSSSSRASPLAVSFTVAAVITAAACVPEAQRAPPCDEAVCTLRDVEGEAPDTLVTVFDATDETAVARFDLDTAGPTADDADDGWDLAIRRFAITTNSGVSGNGDVRVWFRSGGLEDVDGLADIADGEGFVDLDDGDDRDEDADSAFLSPGGTSDPWYDYDLLTHTLSPKARVYGVRTTTGAAFALALRGYYDEEAVAGHLSFAWKTIDP
jgi:hypothetical protein